MMRAARYAGTFTTALVPFWVRLILPNRQNGPRLQSHGRRNDDPEPVGFGQKAGFTVNSNFS